MNRPHTIESDLGDTEPSAVESAAPLASAQVELPRDASVANGPIIRFDDVHKSFGPLNVLRGVSLDFEQGRNTVILGPSGTGKSVLLKHMVGLLRPDKGEVWFEDTRVDTARESKLVEIRRHFGFLFQMGALFDSMNVAENVCFPLIEHTRMPKRQRLERAVQALAMVGLPDIEKKMPGELSGGQKKRVALARAVVMQPKVILYDEPTTGLDPIRSDVINELILAMNERLGATSIVVTHDIASARKVAHRMVMPNEGQVVADGDPATFEDADNPIVRRFMRGEAAEDDIERIKRGFTTDRRET